MKVQKNEHGQTEVLPRGLNRVAAASQTSVKNRSIGGRLRISFRCGDEGQSLIEFAVVLPVFLLLITGMFSVVMAVMSYEQLGEATFAGSQVLQNGRGMLSNGDPCASVATAVTASLPTWTATQFTYTVTITDSTGTPSSSGALVGPSPTCTSLYTSMANNEPATLTVSYSYTWMPTYLWNPGTSLLSRSQTVSVE